MVNGKLKSGQQLKDHYELVRKEYHKQALLKTPYTADYFPLAWITYFYRGNLSEKPSSQFIKDDLTAGPVQLDRNNLSRKRQRQLAYGIIPEESEEEYVDAIDGTMEITASSLTTTTSNLSSSVLHTPSASAFASRAKSPGTISVISIDDEQPTKQQTISLFSRSVATSERDSKRKDLELLIQFAPDEEMKRKAVETLIKHCSESI